MPTVGYVLTGLLGYLLGSIPTGFLVGKAKGVDIRKVGSGNIGATNVLRAVGTPAGVCVLLADALKGWAAVAVLADLMYGWFSPGASAQAQEWYRVIGGVTAILGHNYTCWLHFKGGKGIATSAGVLAALVTVPLLIILSIWIIVFAATRYVSLASICASFALPFAVWLTGGSWMLIGITAGLTTLAICKHKPNIQRLLKGTESRIAWKKAAPTSTKPTI